MSPSRALPDLTGEAVSFNLTEPSLASVAQSVEQLIRNQQVGGSIPLAGSTDSPGVPNSGSKGQRFESSQARHLIPPC